MLPGVALGHGVCDYNDCDNGDSSKLPYAGLASPPPLRRVYVWVNYAMVVVINTRIS